MGSVKRLLGLVLIATSLVAGWCLWQPREHAVASAGMEADTSAESAAPIAEKEEWRTRLGVPFSVEQAMMGQSRATVRF